MKYEVTSISDYVVIDIISCWFFIEMDKVSIFQIDLISPVFQNLSFLRGYNFTDHLSLDFSYRLNLRKRYKPRNFILANINPVIIIFASRGLDKRNGRFPFQWIMSRHI